jgi:hypothetical protein
MKTMLDQLTSVEGTASDVRQAGITIILNGVGYDESSQCLFRLSDMPVDLRVNGPVFIQNGETVRVVGKHNWNGVFDAVAYYNRSSGASGNSGKALAQRLCDKMMATICLFGITLGVVGPITSSLFVRGGHLVTDLLFMVCSLFILPLVIIGSRRFLRYRSETRTIEKLLND